MASTNKTPHYNLPQFIGSDKPSWLGDVNDAMSKIDTAIFGAATVASEASEGIGTATENATNALTAASEAKATASQASLDASAAQTSATNAVAQATTAQTAATAAQTSANNAATSASQASESASAAVTTANNALTAANEAKEAATGAIKNDSLELWDVLAGIVIPGGLGRNTHGIASMSVRTLTNENRSAGVEGTCSILFDRINDQSNVLNFRIALPIIPGYTQVHNSMADITKNLTFVNLADSQQRISGEAVIHYTNGNLYYDVKVTMPSGTTFPPGFYTVTDNSAFPFTLTYYKK